MYTDPVQSRFARVRRMFADPRVTVSEKPAEPYHKDEGSLEDLIASVTSRRRALGMFGASALTTGLLAACGGGSGGASVSTSGASSSSTSSSSSGSSSSSASSSTGTCNPALPQETNGPYPADGSNTASGSVVNVLTQSGIVRSDIRTSIGSYSGTAPGVPLTLTITLVNTSLGCAPLANYAIYIWHCTRDGYYSLYTLTGQNYLRGVQVTDSNGQVTFTTIVPGCYSGRMPHIHVEVYASLSTATAYSNAVRTTQFGFDRTVCETVYNGATGYSASVANLAAITFATDNVFNTYTSAQLAAATLSPSGSISDGYTASVQLGVAV